MKVFLYLLTLLSFFSIDLNKKELNIKSSYQEINDVVYNYDKYKVIERNNIIEILYNDTRIELLNNVYCYKIIINDELLTVFYKNSKNDYIYVKKYNKGKISINKQINNKFLYLFDVVYCNDSYILVSTISEYENSIITSEYKLKQYLKKENGVILRLNNNLEITECKLYGGQLNDSFTNIYFDDYNEIIYITGSKDQNSGYDFSNGGNGATGYLFIQIDEFLNIENYIIFDFEIKNVEISEKIKIFTICDFFLIDRSLNLVSTLRFDAESVFGVGVDKKLVVSFGIREAKFYDYERNLCLFTYEYKDIYELEKVKIIEDYLVLKDKYKLYKGVFYNDLFSNVTFNYDNLELSHLNTEVIGVPCNFKMQDITYEENYDPLIFGIYSICFNYKYFTIQSKIEVLERSNIVDGNIYPTGYNIFFSGVAYLNGEEIYNNHELVEEGEYSLKLVGKDEERIINFKVYNMDITFLDESIKNYNYEVSVNQDLIIDFDYNDDIYIKKIIINDEESDFENDEENNKIIIKLKHQLEGDYEYFLSDIIYEKENKLYTKEINYFFKVRVLQNKMLFDNDFYNTNEDFIFSIKFDNTNNQLRYLKIITDTKELIFPIKNGVLTLNENFENNQSLKFYLVYDIKSKLYEEQMLFELKYDFYTNDIGLIELKKENDILKEMIIKIPISKSVKQILVEDNICYQYNKGKQYNFIIYGIIFVSATLICYKIIRTCKIKKRKK